MWLLKTILMVLFFTILYQDCKERLVHWFLYPAVGLLAFAVQYALVPLSSVLLNVGVNLIVVSLVLLTSYGYSRIRKIKFNEAFGIGDVLFFVFITSTFSVISFVVLFVFALLFSLILHVIVSKSQEETVPLAGYMSLFFGCVYGSTFFCESTFLYTV
jgi:hypothetical protein